MKTKLVTVSCLSFGMFLFSSCKKDKAAAEEQIEFTVVEQGSNKPLAGATVQAYKCNSADWIGNCSQLSQHLATATTNGEGKAFFAKSLGVQTLVIKKEHYLDLIMPNLLTGPFMLIPAATLKVRFVRVNQYAPPNQLFVQYMFIPPSLWSSKGLGLPADTTIYLQGVGDEQNGVDWMVDIRAGPPFHSAPPVMIKKFDTAAFSINY